MKELAALAYRDTTQENREFWKNEMGNALREISATYDEKLDAMRGELESHYNMKVAVKTNTVLTLFLFLCVTILCMVLWHCITVVLWCWRLFQWWCSWVQEMKELVALAYRDTTSENRTFWKNEMSKALREIQETYDEKLLVMRQELETYYNLKVKRHFRLNYQAKQCQST